MSACGAFFFCKKYGTMKITVNCCESYRGERLVVSFSIRAAGTMLSYGI